MSDEFRVEVETMVCIGAENCMRHAPGAFELNEDGQAILLDESAATREQFLAAEKDCPSGAIRVVTGS
jgi:ferredoxin